MVDEASENDSMGLYKKAIEGKAVGLIDCPICAQLTFFLMLSWFTLAMFSVFLLDIAGWFSFSAMFCGFVYLGAFDCTKAAIKRDENYGKKAKEKEKRQYCFRFLAWTALGLSFISVFVAIILSGDWEKQSLRRRLQGNSGGGSLDEAMYHGAWRTLSSNSSANSSSIIVRAMGASAVRENQAFIPEILFRGRWYPICGEGFRDNDAGATTVCKMIGNFDSGVISDNHDLHPVHDEFLPIGMCEWSQPLEDCSGRYTTTYDENVGQWANYTFPPSYLCNGYIEREYVQISCFTNPDPADDHTDDHWDGDFKRCTYEAESVFECNCKGKNGCPADYGTAKERCSCSICPVIQNGQLKQGDGHHYHEGEGCRYRCDHGYMKVEFSDEFLCQPRVSRRTSAALYWIPIYFALFAMMCQLHGFEKFIL